MKSIVKKLLMTQVVLSAVIGSTQLFAQRANVGTPPSVAYRLKESQTIHFDDSGKAQLHLDAVKKLGCEARMDDHGGHMDVTYRLTSWTALTLADENTAHQWEAWMKKSGFETLHAHTEDHDHSEHNHTATSNSHAGHNHALEAGHFQGDGHDHGHASVEIVGYSLPNWTTANARNMRESEELVAILKGLGCEVQVAEQGDVTFRCPQPMHVEFPSHQVATGWEGWMNKTGFRTQHTH